MSAADGGGTLNDDVRNIWNANAAFWDAHMGDAGNDFHQQLVAPSAERLLGVQSGETVLEIACGSGLFARRLAELGARVVATDLSRVFLERARVRAGEWAAKQRIEFHLVDATDPVQLMALGERRFDAAVCNMALMDMAEIEPLFEALARLLAPGPRGRFVFTLSHPCFNTTGCARVVEETDRGDGTLETTYAVKVSRYKGLAPARGIGIVGQPRPHWYFDPTLADLFGAAFRAGWVLDGLEEPVFSEPSERPRSLDFRNFNEIPLLLAARMRLAHS